MLLLCAFPVVQRDARGVLNTKKTRQKVHPVLPQHILWSSSTHTLSRSLALFVAHLTIKLTTLELLFPCGARSGVGTAVSRDQVL